MDLARWREENGQYLAASLTWLRLRLAQLAEQTRAAAQLDLSGAPTNLSKPDEGAPSEQDLRVREALEACEQAAKMDPPPALHLLAEQLRLTLFERKVVLLCVAMEFDTRIPELCARAMGNLTQPYPTFALAFSLFDEPNWDAHSPQRPLRFLRVIDVHQAPMQPLTSAPLRADERIVNYVKGLNSLEPRLSLLLTPVDVEASRLPPSQQTKVDDIVDRWSRANPEEPPPAAVLLGVDSTSKLLVAQAVSAQLQRTLFRIGLDALPAQVSESETLARLWQREAALLPLALYVDAQSDSASPDALAALNRFVTRALRSDSFLFIGTREPLAY